MNFWFLQYLIFIIGAFPVVLPSPQLSADLPAGIDWFKVHKRYQLIEEYRYYLGSVSSGQVIYYSKVDILGLRAELQINFVSKEPISATLILGPNSLGHYNCVSRYKELEKLLTRKYGHFRHKKVVKDPIIEELVYSNLCYPIELGIYQVDTEWFSRDFHIILSLFGDGEDIFIEIQYDLNNREAKEKRKELKKNVLRRL